MANSRNASSFTHGAFFGVGVSARRGDQGADGTLIATLASTVVLLLLFSIGMQWQVP